MKARYPFLLSLCRGFLSALGLGLAACWEPSREPSGPPHASPGEPTRAALASSPPAIPEVPIHKRIDQPSIVSCGGCHFEVYQEWSSSLHGRAWTNANVQLATRGFEKASCRKCHSPQPVLGTGLLRAPDYRDFNQEDGVHCLSCHALEDGVAAARTIPDAPCRPRLEPRLLSANLCFPCHEPTHGAFEEYWRSDAFALGLRCADCHMQTRASGSGHSHGANGGLNPDFVQRALDWSVEQASDRVLLTLRNRAGHRFPGEIPSRSFLIRVLHDQQEVELITLRKPRKGETRNDDRLKPDEVRLLTFQVPQEVQSMRLELYFRPLPLTPLKSCFSLGDWSWERPAEGD